jgi:hypothetical protein
VTPPMDRWDLSKKGAKKVPPPAVAQPVSKPTKSTPPSFPAVMGVTQTNTSVNDLMLSLDSCTLARYIGAIRIKIVG